MGFKKTKKVYIVIEEMDWNTKTKTVTKTEIDEEDANKILHPLPDYEWGRPWTSPYDRRRENWWNNPFDDNRDKWGY